MFAEVSEKMTRDQI